MTRREAVRIIVPLTIGGIASRSGKAATVFGQLTIVANWYVDSVGGSDSNNGTSITTPLQTIAALLAKTITAGQTVAIKTDSVFLEKYSTPANSTALCTYGTGARPIFDSRDVAAAGSFSKTGGQTLVYQIAVTVEATGSTWVSAWEDSTRMVRAASIAACDATPGSYFPSSDSTASITLYVHASDGSNPASNGKAYRYTKRYAGYDDVTGGHTGCKVIGIKTIGNLANDGSLQIGKNGYGYSCLATEGSKHNVYLRTGATAYSVTASEAYFGGQSFILFVHNENTPNNEGVRYVNCSATLSTYDPLSQGFYGHTNTSGSFGQVIWDTCTTDNCSIGIAGVSQASAVLRNCTITNANICVSADHDWLITGLSGQANQGGNPQVLSVGSTNVEVIGLTGSTTGYWIWILTGCSAYIHDCDWSAVSGPIMISLRGANASIRTRSITFAGGSQPYNVPPSAVSGMSIDSDNNVFTGFGASGIIGQINSVDKTWAQWQALGYDAHSTET